MRLGQEVARHGLGDVLDRAPRHRSRCAPTCSCSSSSHTIFLRFETFGTVLKVTASFIWPHGVFTGQTFG
jgi:hypothetical protein